jgi:polysaccharide biosynthesis protein PslH
MNGGMVRCINLLHQLSNNFEVTAIMHQHTSEFKSAFTAYPALANCNMVSTKEQKLKKDLFSFLPQKIASALRQRYWTGNLFGSANLHFLKIYPVVKQLLHRNKFDYIVLEDILLMSLVPLIRKMQPGAKIVYDAYNVNARLLKTQITDSASEESYYKMFKDECNLYKQVDTAFVCSETDLKELGEMNQGRLNCIVIPNGVGVAKANSYPAESMTSNEIIFCGSLDYEPNREGLIWFFKDVFPKVFEIRSDVKLSVVGKGNPGAELMQYLQHPSVNYHGMVPDVVPYYKQAVLAVVPLLSGSGTRLKVLEAMGLGTPVLSTEIGAEGIEYTKDVNIVIAGECEVFAQKIIHLINNPAYAVSVSKAAYDFVSNRYDWNIIGTKMKNYFLQQSLS